MSVAPADPADPVSRRAFLRRSGSVALGLAATVSAAPPASAASAVGSGRPRGSLRAADPPLDGADWVSRIRDAEIRAGVEAAISRNLLPAAIERAYPGHFAITADDGAFGGDATWPGLDSWQMAGAYLRLGRTRLVLDYFEFVRASQRKDGNIPFAVFPGDTRPDGGCLRGLKHPEDVFSYEPPKREGLPPTSQATRSWIGLFEHWQTKGFPLSNLGPICYVLTAAEIFDVVGSRAWLEARLPSVESALKWVLGRKLETGLVGGSGFYIEAPPREGADGVTQCYAVHACRELARLFRATGDPAADAAWNAHAEVLSKAFVAAFWRKDHFGEYVHPERGLVDSHGLSDVNWAALAFGIADASRIELLWPLLTKDPGFWLGGMPTQSVTKPFAYESWELNVVPSCSVSPVNDVAAMGRVWYLEATACRSRKASERLVESVRRVSRAAKADGYWRERYHPRPDGSVVASGAQKYCEYAAVLLRVVHDNIDLFTK